MSFKVAWTGANGHGNHTLSAVDTTGANFIVITLALEDNSAPSISDNKGNTTWTLVDGPDSSSTDFIRCYIHHNPTVGSGHTITITYAGHNAVAAAAYDGMLTSGTFDKAATGTGSGTALDSGNTATIAQANELLIGYGTVSTGSNSTFSAGTNFTMRSQAGDASASSIVFLEDRIVSSAAAYNAPATWNGSGGSWIQNIATFKMTSTGQSAAIGLTTETDTAFSISHKKTKALGLATEADTALAIRPVRIKPIGLATETDTALAMTHKKVKAIGLATETDTALGMTRSGSAIAIGLATETDTALAMTHAKAKALGLATEADTALAMTHKKVKAIGLATETDTALAMRPNRLKPIGLATETDTAFSFGRLKTKLLGLAEEFDSAISMTSNAIASVVDGAIRLLLRRR